MKKVLIIFTDVHLAYSPTTLNLFYELKKNFDVELMAPEAIPGYSPQFESNEGIRYVNMSSNSLNSFCSIKWNVKKAIGRYFGNSVSKRKANLIYAKTINIIKQISGFQGEIIAVDFLALWCVQQINKRAHFLSLEIGENDPYRNFTDHSQIKSVIIQSKERYDYLFSNFDLKYFIVQNSPENVEFSPEISLRDRNQLIFCGSAVPNFGIISCLDFIKDYPQYTLTIKGAIPESTLNSMNSFYKDLLIDKRVIIDNSYLTPTDLTYFVSKFRIGFAFYDFYRFESMRTFNYFTAPSGKVFQYLNSGVPIVANDLPAFRIIEERGIGKLISHLSSQEIKSAIDEIEKNYEATALNAKLLSKSFDFSVNIKDFTNYLDTFFH